MVGGLTGDQLPGRRESDRPTATCNNGVVCTEFGEDKRHREHRWCDFIYMKFKSGKNNPKMVAVRERWLLRLGAY